MCIRDSMVTACLGHECAAHGMTAVAMHPGWVRTRMGGDAAPLGISESVTAMVRTIRSLDPSRNGEFVDRDGQRLPW